MRLERGLRGALPTTPLERWNDEQLAAIFATGINYSEYHQRGNMDVWLKSEDAVLDFRYIQSQLSQIGQDAAGVLTQELFRQLHGTFDLRPIVAAFMREIKTNQLKEPVLDVLPPLEILRLTGKKTEVRLTTFRDVLLRHSFVPQPHSTSPNIFRRLESLNPLGRRFDQINILQLPSVIVPPR
jgi:hypothetical protein